MLQQYQDRERELQCPFEPSHLVRHYRLVRHINKCSQSHPEKKMIRCPFDASHIVDPATFGHHMENCESSGSIWNAIYTTEPEKQVGTVSIQEACENQPRFLEEDWDGNHKTYDPIKHTENKDVTRMIQCVPKKERKIFKLKERQRMAALEKANNGSPRPQPIIEKKEEFDAPLRRPKALPKAISRNSSMTRDTSFSQFDNSLDSQFAKSLSINEGRVKNDKENIWSSRNASLVEKSFARDNTIDLEKSAVAKDESARSVEKQANASFSSIIGKHSKVENQATKSFEKNQSRNANSTQANSSYKSAVSKRRQEAEDSSSDDSSSDSDSSDLSSDDSNGERPFMLARTSKTAYKPCVGRGLKLLFNNNGPVGKHDTSCERKSEKPNTSIDYAKKYGYEA